MSQIATLEGYLNERSTKMARRLPPPLDFPPIEDLAGFGFLDNVLDPEMLREAVQLGLGGAGAAVAFSLAVENIKFTRRGKDGIVVKDADNKDVKDPWFDRPWKRILLATALGLGGGAAGWRYGKRELARGVMASMAGIIGVEVKGAIQEGLTKKAGPVAGLDTDYDAEAALNAFFATPEEQDLLAAATEVEPLASAFQRRQGGQVGDVDVEDDGTMADVGSWIS